MLKTECLEFSDNRSLVKVEEKRSSILFENVSEKKVSLYNIDGCIIKSGQRCDKMLLIDDFSECHLIELKGRDVEHAMDQISATISTNKVFLSEFQQLNGWIISTKVSTPAIRSTKMQKLKKLLKVTGGELYTKKSGSKHLL